MKKATFAIARRRRSRGVAMVEGAVVFPVMAMFLFFLEMAHHSYDSYITVTHVERERSWSTATIGGIAGCDAGNVRDDTTYSANVKYFKMDTGSGGGNALAGDAPNPPAEGKASVPNMPGSAGFFKWTGQASAQTEWGRGGHSVKNTESASGIVYCNQSYHGGLLEIIESAFKKF